jgi:hypothetical protein
MKGLRGQSPWDKRYKPAPDPAELAARHAKQALAAIEWQLKGLDRASALSVLLAATRAVKSWPTNAGE